MLDHKYKVYRFVSEFHDDSDELIADHDFKAFDLPMFQREFNISPDDPMFACSPIGQDQAEFISRYLEEPIAWDFDNRSYFVDASAA